MKLSIPRTYTAKYTDADGNDVSDSVTSVWTVTSDFDVEQTIDGNSIELNVDDDNVIDEAFLLRVVDSNGYYTPVEIEITVVDV